MKFGADSDQAFGAFDINEIEAELGRAMCFLDEDRAITLQTI